MYKLCSIAVAIGLAATSMAWAGPLSAGKPAGVHQAQMSTGSIITAAGLGVIAVTVIAVAASGDDTPAQSQGSSTTTTTTTTS